MVEAEDGIEAQLEDGDGKSSTQTFDKVLVAVGRVPNTQDLGLEITSAQVNERGFIGVDAQRLRRAHPILPHLTVNWCTGEQLQVAWRAVADFRQAVSEI